MRENLIQKKSYEFALKIINLSRDLQENKKEFVISRQILKSGTSIGANVEEAIGGQSKLDFKSKLSIAYKEARETRYWINLLKDSKYCSEKDMDEFLSDIEDLCKILGKIISTLKVSR